MSESNNNMFKIKLLNCVQMLSLLLIACCCTSKNSDNKSSEKDGKDKVVFSVPRVCDSIKIKRIMPLGCMDNADTLVVELRNPYNDNVVIESNYSIRKPNDSILYTGKMPQTIIPPNSSREIAISIGLDSIKFSKNKIYKFIFIGKHNGTCLIFYDILRIGTRYKKENKYIWEPDTIVLC